MSSVSKSPIGSSGMAASTASGQNTLAARKAAADKLKFKVFHCSVCFKDETATMYNTALDLFEFTEHYGLCHQGGLHLFECRPCGLKFVSLLAASHHGSKKCRQPVKGITFCEEFNLSNPRTFQLILEQFIVINQHLTAAFSRMGTKIKKYYEAQIAELSKPAQIAALCKPATLEASDPDTSVIQKFWSNWTGHTTEGNSSAATTSTPSAPQPRRLATPPAPPVKQIVSRVSSLEDGELVDTEPTTSDTDVLGDKTLQKRTRNDSSTSKTVNEQRNAQPLQERRVSRSPPADLSSFPSLTISVNLDAPDASRSSERVVKIKNEPLESSVAESVNVAEQYSPISSDSGIDAAPPLKEKVSRKRITAPDIDEEPPARFIKREIEISSPGPHHTDSTLDEVNFDDDLELNLVDSAGEDDEENKDCKERIDSDISDMTDDEDTSSLPNRIAEPSTPTRLFFSANMGSRVDFPDGTVPPVYNGSPEGFRRPKQVLLTSYTPDDHYYHNGSKKNRPMNFDGPSTSYSNNSDRFEYDQSNKASKSQRRRSNQKNCKTYQAYTPR